MEHLGTSTMVETLLGTHPPSRVTDLDPSFPMTTATGTPIPTTGLRIPLLTEMTVRTTFTNGIMLLDPGFSAAQDFAMSQKFLHQQPLHQHQCQHHLHQPSQQANLLMELLGIFIVVLIRLGTHLP